MAQLPGFTALKDKRVKNIDYIECMYTTEDDRQLLFRYDPKGAGTEEGIITVEKDASGYNLLTLKYHFSDSELQVIEIGE